MQTCSCLPTRQQQCPRNRSQGLLSIQAPKPLSPVPLHSGTQEQARAMPAGAEDGLQRSQQTSTACVLQQVLQQEPQQPRATLSQRRRKCHHRAL